MLNKPLIVIKVGTQAITDRSGDLNIKILDDLVRQIVKLNEENRIVLVSSGAVGCGKNLLPHYNGKIPHKKAAAAIGNPLLMRHYQYYFSKHSDILVAQALCEKQHFTDRTSFLQIWETFQSLWKEGVIPIVNENDVVCDYEIRFSDNDELATVIACGFSAQQLLLGTGVEGVLDGKGEVIPKIEDFTDEIFGFVNKNTSTHGRGGMHTKIQCARKACGSGCEVVIFDGGKKGNVLLAHKHKTGTVCVSKSCSLGAHRKWISMGGKVSGKVTIDAGAQKAISNRKSLLFVGVKTVEGTFGKGDLLGVYDESGNNLVALGRSKFGSEELEAITEKRDKELIRTDELVLVS